MQLRQPSPAQAHAGLRALKMIGEADGPMGPAHQALMEAAQRNLLKTDHDLNTLTPITASELAAAIDEPALAEQLVHAMALASVVDDAPGERRAALLSQFREALKAEVPEVQVLIELAHRQSVMFRLDFYRRSHMRGVLEEQMRKTGFVQALRQFAAFRGVTEDLALGARYRALGELGVDTLGYAFFRHCVDNGFAFPGELHGFPEGGIYHDFAHVLSGYTTSSEDEVLIGAFISGFRKENPAFVTLFVMLTFGAGINMTPLPIPQRQHILATPGLADRFFRAMERGGKVKVDLSRDWNHWDWVGMKLDDARRTLGIEPE